MASILRVPVTIVINAEVHEIEGGGFWAEVTRFPGCVAQAETLDVLKENILQAIEDWWAEVPAKTGAEAKQLAVIQGSDVPPGGSYPQPYHFLPPASWSDEDE